MATNQEVATLYGIGEFHAIANQRREAVTKHKHELPQTWGGPGYRGRGGKRHPSAPSPPAAWLLVVLVLLGY